MLSVILQQGINGIVVGSLYVLVALGLTLIYGVLVQINFAHADIVTLGAFNWAGSMAATSASTRAWVLPTRTLFVNMRWSWSRSGRTSSWLIAPTRCLPCCRRPALFRSFSRPSPIRSAPAMSRVWHGRVGA